MSSSKSSAVKSSTVKSSTVKSSTVKSSTVKSEEETPAPKQQNFPFPQMLGRRAPSVKSEDDTINIDRHGYVVPDTPRGRGRPKKEVAPESEVEFVDSPPPKLGAPTRKAMRAREKALTEKFEIVQAHIGSKLETTDGVIVDCFFKGDTKTALMDRNYDYNHLLKLRSDQPFNLVKTVLFQEGPYAGNVGIILKQSKQFPFLQLPVHIRAQVLFHVVNDPRGAVRMALKQGGTKSAFAPGYTARNRLAILRVNKEIYDEVITILYGQCFHFPGTQVVSAFMLQIGGNRKYLRYIRSDTYNAHTARTMFHLLQECKNLRCLSFAHFSSNEQPKTAIKNLYNDAHIWLLGIDKNNPITGMEVLHFDDNAFHMREKAADGNGFDVVAWSSMDRVMFLKGLKQKLEQAGRRF